MCTASASLLFSDNFSTTTLPLADLEGSDLDNQTLEKYPEFQAAMYIDSIYVPICATLGIVGNVLVFLVLVRSRTKSTTYVYMSSLSVSDTLVQIANILFYVNKFPGHETITENTCGLLYSFFYFSIHFNVLVMVTMTIERYLAIGYPLSAGRWFTQGRARALVVVQAVLVAGFDSQHLFISGMAYDGVPKFYCRVKQIYGLKIWPWIDGAIYCYGPLTCLVIFNILIVRQVRSSSSFQSRSAGQSAARNNQRAPYKMSEKELQMTRMLLVVTLTFLVCVSPMAVIIVVERYLWLRVTTQDFARQHLVRTILNNLDYTNHAVNFFLYCFAGRRFRRELVESLGCFCPSKVKARTSAKMPAAVVGPALTSRGIMTPA